MNRLALWTLAGALVAFSAGTSSVGASDTPFRPALEAHLAAVAGHNMEALLPTLTSSDALTMITPDGRRLSTRQEYIDFHRRWFAADDKQEKLEFETQRVIETPVLAHALLRIRYTFTGAGGAAQNYVGWLTLTFALEGDRWALVFDQNTAIKQGS